MHVVSSSKASQTIQENDRNGLSNHSGRSSATHALQTRCTCFTCFTSACVPLTCTCVRQSTQQKMFFDNLYTKNTIIYLFICFRAKLQRKRRCIEREPKKKMMETKTGGRPKWKEFWEEFFSTSSISNTTLEKIHMRATPADKIQRNSFTTTRFLWLSSTPSFSSCSSCPCSFCSRRNGTQFTRKFTCFIY